MASEHIVKSYDEELKRLDNSIVQMGGMAEAQLAAAVESVVKGDSELAQRVIADDDKVDDVESEVDTQAVRLIALRQPMAADLRIIVAALKISSDIERIADHAANISKRSQALNELQELRPYHAIPRLGAMAQQMLNDVLDAYVARDAHRAVEIWLRDRELDEAYNGLFRELLTYMMEDPRNITSCTQLLFIAKNIERIGDHITNIAESIYYLMHGNRLRDSLPEELSGPTVFDDSSK